MESNQTQPMTAYPPQHSYVKVSPKIFIPKEAKPLTPIEFKMFIAMYHNYRMNWPFGVISYLSHDAGIARKSASKAFNSLKDIGVVNKFYEGAINKNPESYVKLPRTLLKLLNGLACKVYCYIAYRNGIKNYHFAAKRIGADIGHSERSVENALNTLINKNLLKRERTDNRRVQYSLFCPLELGNSLFDCAQKGTLGAWNSNHIFQIYLDKHDERWNEKHIPLSNAAIVHYCEQISECLAFEESFSLNDLDYYIKKFFNSSTKTDYHFPIFARYLQQQLGDYELLFGCDGEVLEESLVSKNVRCNRS